MRAVGGFPRAKPARRVWVLMRTTSGSGGSLARMVIGVDYSRAAAGSAELPRMKSRAHALGEHLLPNHKVFLEGDSLWRMLPELEWRSLPACFSLRVLQRLRSPSRLNTQSRMSCPIPIALSKAGRPCRRA